MKRDIVYENERRMKTWTFWLRHATNTGETFIGSYDAETILAARNEAVEDCAEFSECDITEVMVVGVAAGDIDIISWCEADGGVTEEILREKKAEELAGFEPDLLGSMERLVETFNPDKQSLYEFARRDIEHARAAIKRAKNQ